MREVHRRQFQLGQVPIEKIWINPKSRDDIPAVLKGLPHLVRREAARSAVYAAERISCRRATVRWGVRGWSCGRFWCWGFSQGLCCDFDRLHDLANHHETYVRSWGTVRRQDASQTVVDNVSLLTPELLSAVGQLVVESGHKVAKKKPGEPLRGRCDSFVVETDVHYPTDVSLLWDAMRCLLRETGRAAAESAVGGWRQWRYWSRGAESVQPGADAASEASSGACGGVSGPCRGLVERAVDTLDRCGSGASMPSPDGSIEGLVAHARRQIDQVERRLLRERPPHEEKVFSIFEEHTRWVSKGKAGTPVELGVPVALIEDQYQFVLHHEVLWHGCGRGGAAGAGSAGAVSGVAERAASTGAHRPDNRVGLDALLDLRVAEEGTSFERRPRREEEESFVAARRVHPAIESHQRASGSGPCPQPWRRRLRACGRLVGAGRQPASHRCCRNVSAHAAAASPDWVGPVCCGNP